MLHHSACFALLVVNMRTAPKKASARGSRAGSSQQPTASSSSPAPHQQRVQPPQTPALASSSKEGVKTRQKRVLPTRSRRGGPGVGSCETDVMILETLKRKRTFPSLSPLFSSVACPLSPSASSCHIRPMSTRVAHAYAPTRSRERTAHPRDDPVPADDALGAHPAPRRARV